MQKYSVYLGLIGLLLVAVSALSHAGDSVGETGQQTVKKELISTKGDASSKVNKRNIDGTTSASKLRAIRSHSVSNQDETKLTVFLGLFAMAIIVFFINFFRNNK